MSAEAQQFPDELQQQNDMANDPDAFLQQGQPGMDIETGQQGIPQKEKLVLDGGIIGPIGKIDIYLLYYTSRYSVVPIEYCFVLFQHSVTSRCTF